jgi:hypothetical protein
VSSAAGVRTSMRSTLAVLAGTVLAFGTVAAIEAAGHRLLPGVAPGPGSEPPSAVLALVWLAWAAGTYIGGWTAARIAPTRRRWVAGFVGAFVLAAALANLLLLPHPAWFVLAGPAGVVAAAWWAGRAPREG